jgi:hypothetical protein
MLPIEVTADGNAVFVIQAQFTEPVIKEVIKEVPVGGKTKCPNCKFTYNIDTPDRTPFFFSIKR